MAMPRGAAKIVAVSIAFRSAEATIRRMSDAQRAREAAMARALPVSESPHCLTGTAGSMTTCGWVR
ncbi:hypothetical protein BH10PSE9_BH10PSE9_19720 [soil metagenome]